MALLVKKKSALVYLILNMLLSFGIGMIFYVPFFKGWFYSCHYVRDFLPDMLWSYSLTFALVIALGIKFNQKKALLIVSAISFIWGLFMEILQLINIAPGTFDLLDILFEGVAAILAGLNIFFVLGRKVYEEV